MEPVSIVAEASTKRGGATVNEEMLRCWRRFWEGKQRGVVVYDNDTCLFRIVSGKRRCEHADDCALWLSQHGNDADAAGQAAMEGVDDKQANDSDAT